MASTQRCLAHLSRNILNTSIRPAAGRTTAPASIPIQQVRFAIAGKGYKKKDDSASKKKKKTRSTYLTHDLKDAEQFALLDAIRHTTLKTRHADPIAPRRYIRAFEVGQNPTSPNKQGQAALAAGAAVVGEEEVFEAVKEGRIDFDRCLCHADSLQKMNKAGLGRILGPKGLLPSAKTGTVIKDTGAAVKEMVGAAEYRERLGVVRMAIGQLGFTPEELQKNIKFFMNSVKKDIAQLSDRIAKDVHEVVLSSTHSPGFSLNGEFRGPESPKPQELATV
ncbi:putative 50s ribosomal protein l1 protein [Botryosphaeria dothidea]|uniref:50s ribosomal protein l1 protein n=1 Tax=Botryosphaeria dothidea TaxID=55169 RepID=A0A8H4J588_9PEZI|nr:putative 50s ribosomal protein l1 protein [Botryosphaeria dothidea]